VVKAVEEFSAKQFTEDVVDNITLYAPCAMGQVVSARNVHSIRFPIICGSANNQLIQDDYAEILQQNGVLYAPDYLANAGGAINVAAEIGQIYDRQNVKKSRFVERKAKAHPRDCGKAVYHTISCGQYAGRSSATINRRFDRQVRGTENAATRELSGSGSA
jgi:glutamate dehydrogenase/leucine dehydrogenase